MPPPTRRTMLTRSSFRTGPARRGFSGSAPRSSSSTGLIMSTTALRTASGVAAAGALVAGLATGSAMALPLAGAARDIRGTGMSVQAIGQPVRREEDLRLLTGRGRYVDDVREPSAARGYVLRSPHAHARIAELDARHAAAAPGVLAVLTGEELRRRGLGTLSPAVRRKRRSGAPAFVCPQPLLAEDRVRYVGDPVAFIIAETLDQAKDAAELIAVEYEPLPAVVGAEAALAPGAPPLWEQNPGNEAFFHEVGDKAAVDAAFAKADHIVRDTIVINRVTANSMEPRGCLAHYDRDQDRYTIRCTIQSVHATRAALADRIFKLPQHQLRVICDNMGGGFGMKGGCYPEYALSLWASEVTGRPVRWIAERSEGLMSDEQGRGSVVETALGARQGGAVSRAARPVEGGDRRLLFDRPPDDTADDRPRLSRQYLWNTGGSRRGRGGADQHDEHRPLSRRQPARAALCDRDDHRQGRPPAAARAGRAAPPEHDSGRRRCRSRRHCSRSTTAATLRRTSRTAWRWPITAASPRAALRRNGAASCWGWAWRPPSPPPAAATTSMPKSASTRRAASC